MKDSIIIQTAAEKKGVCGGTERKKRQVHGSTDNSKIQHQTGNKPRERQQRQASRQKNNDTIDDDKDKFQI